MPDLPPLPLSTDEEYWDQAELSSHKPISVPMCTTHGKENWVEHKGYRDNHDGSVSCKFCPWGTRLAGYYRVHEERVVDLRGL